MADFIPSDTRALYAQMLSLNPLRGSVAYDSARGIIIWDAAPDQRFELGIHRSEGYIALFAPARFFRHKFWRPVTHWHPADDEIWADIQQINL